MNITNEQRRIKLESLDEQLRDLYSSDNTTRMLKAFGEEFKIEKRFEFTVAVGDLILGFYKVAELPKILQLSVGLTPEDAKRLASVMIEFLSPVMEREAAEAKAKKDEVASLADKIAAIQATPETTAEHEPVKPIRTMTADINRAHGYGAMPSTESTEDEPAVKATSQDDIRPANQ